MGMERSTRETFMKMFFRAMGNTVSQLVTATVANITAMPCMARAPTTFR